MRKLFIIPVAISMVLAGLSIVSCTSSTPTEKVINAQKDVNQANKDLDAANAAYLADIEMYRKETADKVMANDKSIADFKVRIEAQKLSARSNYQKELLVLEQKNTDMKKKMEDYKADNKEKWEAFKTEFGRDMDELGNAFKGFVVKNTK
jgi:hypothetical protein